MHTAAAPTTMLEHAATERNRNGVNLVSIVFVYALAQQEWTKGVPASSGASWISVPITFPVNSDQFHIKEGELQCHLSLAAWHKVCAYGYALLVPTLMSGHFFFY